MKSPKGFRGKYFSLAAILALNATLVLASDAQSVANKEEFKRQNAKEISENTEAVEESTLPVLTISKKIKEKKSEVITASKTPTRANSTTDNVSIITSEELSLKGITTVTEALNTATGVNFTSSGGMGKQTSIFLQGMANKYTLLMVDGVRYNDPSNFSGANFEHLLVGDIEKIEIIKGAQSGVWGADAAAGVINIVTKKAQIGTHGSVGLEAGSYGHRGANASLSHRDDKLDAMLSVQRVTEDGFTSYAPRHKNVKQYEKDGYRNTTVNLKTGYWINEQNRIEAGYHDINALNNYDKEPNPNAQERGDFRQKSGYLSYKYFTTNHAIEATLSQNKIERKELDAKAYLWFSEIGKFEGKTPSAELKDSFKYLDNGKLVFGGSYEKREVKYTEVGKSEKEKDENSKAVFANNTNTFDKLVITEALRYDKYSSFESKVTGKLGVKYNFTDDFNIYTNYGTAYKAPSMLETINPWGDSNFDLKPENIKSFNIGLSYAGLGVNFFKNEIKDKISWDSDVEKNLNIDGKSDIKGVELSYEKQLLDVLIAGANYTYIDSKEKGNRTLRIPRYQTGFYATYMPIKPLSINVNGTYVGSRKDSNYSTVDTGNYFVANTKVNYAFSKNFSGYVKVNNLLDRYYQTVDGYATAGRSYLAGVEAKF